ncbi:MAG: hypothetical protein GF405_07675 [Candidatus Eisenbacteria bacterium]|nr:hypothetical protein [Candidatus Eisenbacteria bacterium]
MRQLIVLAVVVLCATTGASADETEIRIGDVPRTGSHFMNAREAALCGAGAATADLSAVFRNPAAAGMVEGAEGFASMRVNIKTRDYLPQGDESLDATDDGLLFSQAAAVKTSDSWSFGFAYATPSYRSLDLSGAVETGERPLESYSGEFTGSFRTFEAVLTSRIGSRGQGIIGLSAGVATINETGREVVGSDLTDSWEIDGLGSCYAVGFIFAPSDRVSIGAGYRFSSEIDVEGTGLGLDGETGTFTTAPIATGGVSVLPTDRLALHASVIREGWHQADVELDPDATAVLGSPSFDDPILTVALGGEFDATEKITLRAGYSLQMTGDIQDAAVPESAFGLGGTYAFNEYYVDAGYTYESFEIDGESGQITNSGLHATVGYRF